MPVAAPETGTYRAERMADTRRPTLLDEPDLRHSFS